MSTSIPILFKPVLFENEYLAKELPDDTVLPLGIIIPKNYEDENTYILYKN